MKIRKIRFTVGVMSVWPTPKGWADASGILCGDPVLGKREIVLKSIGLLGAEAVDRAFSRKMAKYAVEHIVEEAARLVSDGKTILATKVFRFRRDR